MIHKYKMHGDMLVLDVNSSSLHLLDELAYTLLDYYNEEGQINKDKALKELENKYKNEDIIDTINELDRLIEEGTLFSKDIYKEYIPKWEMKSVVKALCLHIAHDCNMRCKYCFASEGDYECPKTLMSLEVGKKAIDFVIENSDKRKNIEIDFFGGEPLLNFDTVKGIVEYARSLEEKYNKNFRFTITTNTLLLDDDKIDYINKNMSNIVLSIDGRKETNDRMRVRVDNSGTYDKILPVAKKVASLRNQDNYYVRGTFTRYNLDFANDVLHLADQGFEQISIEPVVAADGVGYEIREEDIEIANKEYERLAREFVIRRSNGQWFNFFHFMLDLDGGPCVAKRLYGCGSGNEYLAVTPEGDLYPCHQFVGNEKFKMGTVFEGKLDKEIQQSFKNSHIYSKEDCSNCWARFFCSGCCSANAYNFNGDINKPYKIACELQKKRIECSLWIKAQES